MRTRTVRSIFLTALLAGNIAWASPAQESAPAGLRGPVMGYVLDATRQTIRPVNGIPGSSLLGEPLALPFPVAAAAFSPQGGFALAISASDDRTVYVLRNLGGAPDIDPVEGAISADRVFLNSDGSTGALLASDARQLQLLPGLPVSPTAPQPLDLASIPGTITALAIDGTGSNILIGVSDDQGALYLVTTDVQIPLRLIASFGSPAAIVFLYGDQDVIVADAAVNELTLLRNFASTPETFRLATERDGISGPAGLRVSADGRRLYIANGGSRTLDIWNFEAQSIEASHPLDAEPTRLTPLQGSSTFVLNDVGDHPLVLLDAAVNPAVYFVPAGGDR